MRSYDDFQHHLGQRLHGIGQTQAQQLVQALATAVDAQMPVDNFLREPPAMQPHFHALRQAVRSNNWQPETIAAELDALTALEQQHGNGDTRTTQPCLSGAARQLDAAARARPKCRRMLCRRLCQRRAIYGSGRQPKRSRFGQLARRPANRRRRPPPGSHAVRSALNRFQAA